MAITKTRRLEMQQQLTKSGVIEVTSDAELRAAEKLLPPGHGYRVEQNQPNIFTVVPVDFRNVSLDEYLKHDRLSEECEDQL
jgi:hypothetical protein